MSDDNTPVPDPYRPASESGGTPPAPPLNTRGPAPYPSGGAPVETTDAAGFFRALFDFSFSTFITPKVVRAVYVVATVLIGLGWLIFLITSFSESAVAGVFVLVIGPVIALLYLALIRMTLEFYLAVVRMSEDIHKRLPRR